MRFPKFTLVSTIAITLAFCAPLCAEMAGPVPSRRFLPPHPAMRRAGVIFSGTVLKIEHLNQAGSPGVTQITFRVDSAIRGARRGQNLTVREWEGLWNSGERYRVGERIFLFLYANSRLGLTSPVGGSLGRYEIDRAGRVVLKNTGPEPKPIRIQEFAAAIRRAVQEQ